MKKLTKPSKKQVLALLLAALLVLSAAASCISFARYRMLSNVLQTQQSYVRFRGDTEEQFSQVSAFFAKGSEISLDTVGSFRTALETKYTDLSIEADEGCSIYMDAWCGTADVYTKGDTGTASVTALCVGGDFFSFHPLRLLSGSYFTPDDVMDDYVVLDEGLAWRLFGGSDLAGMTMEIDGQPYVIAGVVERETDFASKKAYSGGDSLFMSYSKKMGFDDSAISCYEIAGQDPVKNFIKGTADTVFTSGSVVANSERFSFGSIYKLTKTLAERQMLTQAIAYPYWENAARYIEGLLCPLLIAGFAFAVLPCLAVFIIAIKLSRIGVRRAVKVVPDATDRHRMKKYQGRHPG